MAAPHSTPPPAAGLAAPDLAAFRLAARDRAGELNAQKREGPGDDRASAGGQGKTDKADSAANLPMLKARAAQHGITIVEAADGFLLVSVRWPGWQRELPDLAAVAIVVRRLAQG